MAAFYGPGAVRMLVWKINVVCEDAGGSAYTNMCVRVFVCLCVCMYVYMYVCVYACTFLSMYVCMYVCLCVYMYVCMYVCKGVCTCM